MTPDSQDLLRRIESFDIDGGEAALPFSARLAREHGWSRLHSDRVIQEYKRYVFLAMSSSRHVCPSEAVDAAWHLHLTYTRSYWKRFCGEVLGAPLHHDPTRGGPAEAEKHLHMYDETLAAYSTAFGEEPPADIWPPAEQRFGKDLRQRVVNTASNWVIPKRPVRQILQAAVAFVLVAAFVPGCNGGLNPFELKGANFLVFLVPMLIAAVCLGRVIRSGLLGPGPQTGDDGRSLDWEQAAFLAGGYPRLTTAAIARLAEDNLVAIVEDRLESGPIKPEKRSAVENTILEHLPITKTQLKSVQDSVRAAFEPEVAKLEADGFAVPFPQQVRAAVGSVIPLGLVILLLGLPRLILGLSTGKPAGFLIFTLLAGGIIGLVLCVRGPAWRSRRAVHVLERLRARKQTQHTDAGLAVALFGTAILAGSAVAYLNDWYPRPTASGADGGCGSGCGTSSDGGGGGCGGGGGGCGGCGGGGD